LESKYRERYRVQGTRYKKGTREKAQGARYEAHCVRRPDSYRDWRRQKKGPGVKKDKIKAEKAHVKKPEPDLTWSARKYADFSA
jgi:hypothetical protein